MGKLLIQSFLLVIRPERFQLNDSLVFLRSSVLSRKRINLGENYDDQD